MSNTRSMRLLTATSQLNSYTLCWHTTRHYTYLLLNHCVNDTLWDILAGSLPSTAQDEASQCESPSSFLKTLRVLWHDTSQVHVLTEVTLPSSSVAAMKTTDITENGKKGGEAIDHCLFVTANDVIYSAEEANGPHSHDNTWSDQTLYFKIWTRC